jgi:hypothetical protein
LFIWVALRGLLSSDTGVICNGLMHELFQNCSNVIYSFI